MADTSKNNGLSDAPKWPTLSVWGSTDCEAKSRWGVVFKLLIYYSIAFTVSIKANVSTFIHVTIIEIVASDGLTCIIIKLGMNPRRSTPIVNSDHPIPDSYRIKSASRNSAVGNCVCISRIAIPKVRIVLDKILSTCVLCSASYTCWYSHWGDWNINFGRVSVKVVSNSVRNTCGLVSCTRCCNVVRGVLCIARKVWPRIRSFVEITWTIIYTLIKPRAITFLSIA